MGIRPNQLRLAPVAADAGNATVINVETLGESTIVEAILDNEKEVRIVENGQMPVEIDQRIMVTAAGPAFVFNDQQVLIAEQGGVSDDRLVSVQ